MSDQKALPNGARSGNGPATLDAVQAPERSLRQRVPRTSSADFEDLFENGAVGLHLVGPDGTILRANRAELELLGYQRDEYVGRNIRDFHADEQVISEILGCLGRGEKLDKYPARLKAKDGSIKEVLITSSVLFEKGEFIHTRCFTIDVTAQKQAEEAARRDRELREAIVKTNPECVTIVDRDGRLRFINPSGLRFVGAATSADVLGRSMVDFIVPDDRALWCSQHERVCRGERLSWEFAIVDLSGVQRQAETHATPFTMPDGSTAQLAVTRDISERRRQEQRLRERDEQLAMAEESAGVGVWTIDPAMQTVRGSHQFWAVMGLPPTDEPRPIEATRSLRLPEDRARVNDAFKEALEKNAALFEVEYRIQRPDGQIRWIFGRGRVIRDDRGRPVRYSGADIDITATRVAQAELRETHERLEMVLKTARVGLWEADLASGNLTVSSTCKANFGLATEAEFTHETMFAAMHPEDVPLFRTMREQAFAGQRPYEIEYRNFWPDGSQHWIFTRAMIFRDDAGKPIRLVGLTLDVTERRQAEAALSDSEDRLARLLQLTPLGIAEISPSGRILYANAAAERVLRLTRSEEGRHRYNVPSWQVTTPEGVPLAFSETPPALALYGKTVEGEEIAIVGADGFRAVLSVNAMPTPREHGAASAALVAFTDVTARFDAEAALRESEERFRALANNIPQPAWVANADGWIFWYNQRWHDYTGTTPAEMEGWGWQSVHDPDVLPMVMERWQGSLASGKPFDMVFPLRGADGVFRPFLTRVAPVRDAAGKITRWFGTNTDISEQRRVEDALRRSEAELQRLNETLEQRVKEEIAQREQAQAALFQAQKLEAIGQLTGGVAHDFNNLLTAIIGNLDILGSERLNDRSRRLVDAAIRSAERGGKLTAQLLAYARRQHLTAEAVDVSGLVQGIDDILRRAVGGLVEVQTNLAPDLWYALADPTQLELAILNLAINARDAMPLGGSLTIDATNVAITDSGAVEPGEYVRIAVADTGTGMQPEVLAKAMDPFFTTKDIGKGSGLGLSQVYGLVTQSGGTIRLESKPGEGTTVLLWLPRAFSTPEMPAGQVATSGRSGVRRISVLVVDDDSDVRNVTVEVLKGAGYHVEEAESGATALDIIDNAVPVDLALVDYAMPQMSGTRFIEIARQRRPELPVLYITGYANPHEITTDASAAIVKKPYRIHELLRAVEDALDRSRPLPHANVVPLKPAGTRRETGLLS